MRNPSLVPGLLGFLAAAAALAGCDKNCQNTCARVYDQAQCGVEVPGVNIDSLRGDCVAECQTALTQPGDMNGYNPYDRVQRGSEFENFTLQNEKQAATWMECVWEQECDALALEGGGLCWPIP